MRKYPFEVKSGATKYKIGRYILSRISLAYVTFLTKKNFIKN